MKDLFVELTQLNGCLGTVAAVATALRTEMLADAGHEADLELSLADELLKLSADAHRLAMDIRDRNVGVNFTSEELDGQIPPSRSSSKRSAGKKRPRPARK